jgi:hypothetical protein
MSMDRDELIKRVAYAMHSSAAHSSFWTVDDMRVMATAALAAIEASGHCIVPVPIEADAFKASYAFVDSMIPQADLYNGSAPLWHGWALREAFKAGVSMIAAGRV